MNLRKVVGENVRKLRKEKGWTQEKLAALAKVDQGYIGTLERGQVNVSIDTLAKLGKALGIKPIQFLNETNELNP